jgi:hypothetical protein
MIFACFLSLLSFLTSFEGIHYSCLQECFQTIHLLEVDPLLCDIQPIKAFDNGIGRESVLSIAKRYNALAAINGGFFSIGGLLDGKACGALKIHSWYALPSKPRGCIGWSPHSPVPLFDRLLVSIECHYGSSSFTLEGLNRERKEGEAILFTPVFHRTTLTSPDGKELVIKKGTITSILENRGSSPIPHEGYILSIHKHHPLYDQFVVGMSFSFSFHISSQIHPTQAGEWEQLDYILGGTPLLIHHCKKIPSFDSEKTRDTFLSYRHARTAVGILPNGHWLFAIIDKTGIFDGMTIPELADFMETLECIHALNLDGGGSATLVLNHILKNSPQGDEDEGLEHHTTRRVSDALIITSKDYLIP